MPLLSLFIVRKHFNINQLNLFVSYEKKSIAFILLLALATPSVFCQKVDITWVKKRIPNNDDPDFMGAGIPFVVYYPQVSGCRADNKINRALRASAATWSDYNYKGKNKDGEFYSASATVAITQNDQNVIEFYLHNGWDNGNKGNDHEYYLKFNKRTGAHKTKTVDYSGGILDGFDPYYLNW